MIIRFDFFCRKSPLCFGPCFFHVRFGCLAVAYRDRTRRVTARVSHAKPLAATPARLEPLYPLGFEFRKYHLKQSYFYEKE